MILHLLHYDKGSGGQFARYVIEQFSSPCMSSVFTVMSSPDSSAEFRHPELISYVDPLNHESVLSLIDSLSKYSSIVFHGAFYPWCETILRQVPVHIKVAWMFWGGELYDRGDNFLAPITSLTNRLHAFIKKHSVNEGGVSVEAFRRIDYCLTGVAEEYEYAKQFIQSERLQHIWYTYYSIEDTVGELINDYCTGCSVWICNSASVGNNVFDAMYALSFPRNRRMIRDRKVIMPLSYGAQWVRNAMLRIGPKVFGDCFHPLLEFMPRADYNKLMLDCSTMIMPHYRPAAQGNILTALWLGMRVYLSEKSMSYTFFKRIGAEIYSFESDFKKYGCDRLPEELVQKNREVLRIWYGKDHIIQACNDVVAALR